MCEKKKREEVWSWTGLVARVSGSFPSTGRSPAQNFCHPGDTRMWQAQPLHLATIPSWVGGGKLQRPPCPQRILMQEDSLWLFFLNLLISEVLYCLLSESRSVMFWDLIDSPWNSSGRNTGVGSSSLLQGIFPIQGSNLGLWHCRRILYQLSHWEKPNPK